MAHVIEDYRRGVGGGQEIENVSEGSEIRGQRWRLLRRNDGPEELSTTTDALADEDEPEFSTTTMDASIEKAKYTMRLSERIQRRRRRCVYRIRVLATTMAASAE